MLVARARKCCSHAAHLREKVRIAHYYRISRAACADVSRTLRRHSTRPSKNSKASAATSSKKFYDKRLSWIDRYTPEPMQPYLKLARMDRSSGTWLLLLPCWWSQALGSPGLPDPLLLAKFAVGAFVMRGAGCIVNDLWDRDIDRLVERTRDRPLASGRLRPINALAFLALKLSLGLGVLVTLNHESVLLASASLGCVAVYPLMKRIMPLPQVFLGLTFNWGALVGCTAAMPCNQAHLLTDGVCGVMESLSAGFKPEVALPLYAAGVCWTVVYDSIYALQDMADDRTQGVNSSAIWFSEHGGMAPWLQAFSASMGGCLCAAGALNGLGWIYYAAVAGATGRLSYQVVRATKTRADAETFNHLFMESKFIGLALFAGIVADKFVF